MKQHKYRNLYRNETKIYLVAGNTEKKCIIETPYLAPFAYFQSNFHECQFHCFPLYKNTQIEHGNVTKVKLIHLYLDSETQSGINWKMEKPLFLTVKDEDTPILDNTVALKSKQPKL